MSRRIGLLRTSILAVLLVSGGLLSHFIGGGSFVAPQELLSYSVLVSLCVTLSLSGQLEGPKLALLVLIVQSSSHVILGGMSHSNISMLVSHLTGASLSFWMVQKSDQLLQRLVAEGRKLLNPLIPFFQVSSLTISLPLPTCAPISLTEIIGSTIARRGPPIIQGSSL